MSNIHRTQSEQIEKDYRERKELNTIKEMPMPEFIRRGCGLQPKSEEQKCNVIQEEYEN